MLKSLYSGVSGLQSHQIAMDVESNNIANVNTIGFKYSRANFSDLLAQTSSIATAPQGALGGKNAVQIGLGSTVSSMTRIFSQGSIQNSDKNTDVAIQGDGFFIISPDGGNTYKFTRAGDFKFDAGGNFVDNNGFIAQGWLRDKTTGKVDSTAPITNISIAPGLTTPASPTQEVVLKANLNSGPLVKSFSSAYAVPSGTPPSMSNPPAYTGDAIDAAGAPIASGNVGVMFNEGGEAFSLQPGQGVWASFLSAETTGSTVNDTIIKTFSRAPSAAIPPAAVDDTISVDINGTTYSAAFNGTAAQTYADLETAIQVGEPNISLTAAGNVLTFNPANGTSITVSNLTNDNTSGAGVVSVSSTAHELNVLFTLDDGSTKQISTSGGTGNESAAQNASRYVSAINAQLSITGIAASYNATNNTINLVNDNSNPNASHNIRIAGGGVNSGLNGAKQSVVTAYKYQYDPTGSSALAGTDKTFTTMADLRYAMEVQAHAVNISVPSTTSYTVAASTTGTDVATNFSVNGTTIAVPAGPVPVQESNLVTFGPLAPGSSITIGGLTVTDQGAGSTAVELANYFANLADGAIAGNDTANLVSSAGPLTGWSTNALAAPLTDDFVTFTSTSALPADVADLVISDITASIVSAPVTQGVAANTANENGLIYASAINSAGITGITAAYSGGSLTISNSNSTAATITDNGAPLTDFGLTGLTAGVIPAAVIGDGDAFLNENNIEIKVNEQGKFEITNPGGSDDGDYDMNLKITALTDISAGILANSKFTTNMTALNAVLPAGTTGKAFSQAFNAATHSSSIDIFDSLGSKHTLRMELRKTGLDPTTGSTWDMNVSVPVPASIDTVAPTNEKTGSIRFNNDGSLATYNPPNISFSGNNGSAPDQQVSLSFGTANAFDGMTSFDSVSATSGISQDGFTGGDLVGIRIDQSGTIVGSFSNGRSFGLAQIGMAKFTNNEGLSTEGGNVYIQTANSGDPIIGTAATAGRGFIQSSALEASNVDLSRALTQLIIIQRGYQANGKTITTSDQLLQTLIGLKN